MLTPLINNFNAGELSPLLDGRTDLKKYFSGCRTLKNFMATPYGGAERRPGTYYVGGVKDSSKKTRLISFEYNVEQAYILEFGDQYIRFYKNKGQIVYTRINFGADPSGDFDVGATMTGATSGATAIVVSKISTQVYDIKYEQGTWTDGEIINCGAQNVDCASGYPTTANSTVAAEITSPYLEADLFNLHFVQSADVLYIVDSGGGFQPRKLSRLSHDYWTLEAIDFIWGPFLDTNTTDITITAPSSSTNVATGATITASSERAGLPKEEINDEINGDNNGWSATSSSDEWINFDYGGSAKTVTKLKIDPFILKGFLETDTYKQLRRFKLQGSNVASPDPGENHADWTKISATDFSGYCSAYNTDEVELDRVTSKGKWSEITFDNSTAYRHYRLWCYDNYGASGYLWASEVEMYETLNTTYTSSESMFTSDHVDSIWMLAYPRTDNQKSREFAADDDNEDLFETANCDTLSNMTKGFFCKNVVRLRTHEAGVGLLKVYRSYDVDSDSGFIDTDTWHLFKTLDVGDKYDISWEEPDKGGAWYNIVCTASDEGAWDTGINVILSCEHYHNVCYIKIYEYVDDSNVKANVIKGDEPSGTETKLWAEGAWSDERGWPRAIGFFEGRIVYAANTYNPLTLWFSETNNFEGMWAKTLAENVNYDDDALIFTLSSAEQNMIRWLMGQEALLLGTAGSEGKLKSFSKTEPLTPNNIPEHKPQSSYGSSTVQPILINDVILFIQREGRKVREFKYDFDSDIFVARNLTIYSEHITEGGITQIAHQKQPDSILWAVRDDGVLLGMTYERLEDIYAWSKVVVGGTDAEIESVAVISSAGQDTEEDEVWIIVKRTVDGSTVRYVEYMKPRDWGGTDTDVFFVDSGLSADGSGGNTYVGGLDHLEGETVDILIDGKVGDQQEVGTGNGDTAGYVDLKIGGVATTSTTKLHVGLNYESELQPMKLEIPPGELQTSRGRTKRIHEATISLYKTLGGFIGRDASNLDELDHAVTGTSGSMTPLKTEEDTISFPGNDDKEGNIVIKQTYPLPMTVRSVIPHMEISEI